jgi:hypothetical protein
MLNVQVGFFASDVSASRGRPSASAHSSSSSRDTVVIAST